MNTPTQRAAIALIAGLTLARNTPDDKPFAFVTVRVNPTLAADPQSLPPHFRQLKVTPRFAFLSDGPAHVKKVLAALAALDYQTGFAMHVVGRSHEIVQYTPKLS